MEPADSFLCSQELATGPYPQPHESILHTPHSSSLRSLSVLSSHLHLALPCSLFPSDSMCVRAWHSVHLVTTYTQPSLTVSCITGILKTKQFMSIMLQSEPGSKLHSVDLLQQSYVLRIGRLICVFSVNKTKQWVYTQTSGGRQSMNC